MKLEILKVDNMRKRGTGKEIRICQHCGKTFKIFKCWLKKNKGKFCSLKCMGKARKGKPVWNKGIPHTETTKDKIRQKALGRTGWNKGLTKESHPNLTRLKKEKSPNWRGGTTVYRSIALDNLPVKCAICGVSNPKLLVVHHIDRNRRNNQLNNLQFLCLNCHRLEHYPERKISLFKPKRNKKGRFVKNKEGFQ